MSNRHQSNDIFGAQAAAPAAARSSTRLHAPPGGRSNFSIGGGGAPEPQRTGRRLGGPQQQQRPQQQQAGPGPAAVRSSTRLHAPPGGRSNFSIAGGAHVEPQRTGRRLGGPPQQQQQQRPPQQQQQQQRPPQQQQQQGPPSVRSSTRLHAPPGGKSNFSLSGGGGPGSEGPTSRRGGARPQAHAGRGVPQGGDAHAKSKGRHAGHRALQSHIQFGGGGGDSDAHPPARRGQGPARGVPQGGAPFAPGRTRAPSTASSVVLSDDTQGKPAVQPRSVAPGKRAHAKRTAHESSIPIGSVAPVAAASAPESSSQRRIINAAQKSQLSFGGPGAPEHAVRSSTRLHAPPGGSSSFKLG